ncbi:hypothetical protein CDL12_28205 [Handroanthus impetiginosus]|uniref:Response regulatory domain-containing protein n=1 Tax=Handroanthus impetiginosus TaxID=429701 RepID=A0A2G9G1V7_9LAMI|nr:hypothetical protein CDL12_28482 [Handroanthus impetiginosus]PIM99306.1 hypothetical protein CDL12_28205 [Handroanthus impetiginosus]
MDGNGASSSCSGMIGNGASSSRSGGIGNGASSGDGRQAPVRPHILLVDTIEARCLANKRMFRDIHPCRVSTALSRMEALEFLGLADDSVRRSSFNGDHGPKVNLILTAYDMPEMNGFELLMKIKESALMSNVPIAVLLSEDDPALIERCLQGGANMCITEPLKTTDVTMLLSLNQP